MTPPAIARRLVGLNSSLVCVFGSVQGIKKYMETKTVHVTIDSADSRSRSEIEQVGFRLQQHPDESD